MIVALFGSSGCGKTTLATMLAGELNVPIRHCGNEIREAARAENHTLASAPNHLHQTVDRQTVDWCEAQTAICIVEGRFLDQVLVGVPEVLLVQLVAAIEVRADRLAQRSNQMTTLAAVAAMDQEDDLFRRRMYPDSSSAAGRLLIDTGGGTPLECCQKLISLISRQDTVAQD